MPPKIARLSTSRFAKLSTASCLLPFSFSLSEQRRGFEKKYREIINLLVTRASQSREAKEPHAESLLYRLVKFFC